VSPVAVEKPKAGGGGRPPVIDQPRGYGGEGGRGDDAPDAAERLKRYRLGMALALVAISTLFVAVTVTFVLRQRYGGHYDLATNVHFSDWISIPLPWELLAFNTLLLVSSSFTIEMARRSAIRSAVLGPVLVIPGIRDDLKQSPWLAMTIVLGSAFVAGQAMAWRWVASRGFFVNTGPSTSFFYLLTGTHALHLIGGLLVLTYAAISALRHRRAVSHRITVDVASWYWHTMGVLWIYILLLLMLVR
jgi:cytochrome c oxidase subunit 3